jgi:serine/threonine protein kinase
MIRRLPDAAPAQPDACNRRHSQTRTHLMDSGQKQNFCTRCGHRTSDDGSDVWCAKCGYSLEEADTSEGLNCFTCGGLAPRGAAYCPSCGQPFTVIIHKPLLPSRASDVHYPSRSPVDGSELISTAVSQEIAPASEDAYEPDNPHTAPVSNEELALALERAGAFAWKNVNTEQVFDTDRDAGRIVAVGEGQREKAVGETPRSYPEDEPETAVTGASAGKRERADSDSTQFALRSSVQANWPARVLEAGMLSEGSLVAGRYQVTRQLGSGGFANIYLVSDSEDYLQEELVLKLVDERLMRHVLGLGADVEPIAQDDLIKAWRSKLKAWKVISEQAPSHIVRLLGVPRIVFGGRNSYSVGLLMEYMPGGDLWQFFKSNGAPRSREQLTETIQLFLSACRAVGILHANKLLHRDIKPSNFLLDSAQTHCKLSDFELITEIDEHGAPVSQLDVVGTPIYMAPECFEAKYSLQSDIFALGATLYHLLTGFHPRNNLPNTDLWSLAAKGNRPKELTQLNPLISAELNEVVLRCLDDDPTARPSSVEELQDELVRLGLTGDSVNIAPVNLARLLLTHLPPEDVQDLVESLEENGFHSASADTAQRQKDIVEEYCYTASPYDVLKDNCTLRQLKALTNSLGLKERPSTGRDDLIEEILTSVGFLASAREVPGIEATRTFLENLRLNLAHATTLDECVGMVQAGLSAVERTVDLLLSFYGQLLLGAGLRGFLKKAGKGKPPERLTFGEKLGALRQLCTDSPPPTLPSRVRQVFKFPLIGADVFKKLSEVVKQRNLSAHSPHEATRRSLAIAQRSGRQLLEHAVVSLTELSQNPNVPRVVQIVSRQDDIYGRHFYLGRDDRGRSERIFTPLPLNVGRLYLFFPLTNPARINPLIFPFDTQDATPKSQSFSPHGRD